MSTSAFGVVHKADRGDYAAGAVGLGGLTYATHVAGKKAPKAMAARRGAGILGALVQRNPVALTGHVRGAIGDAKKIGALKGARYPLALGTAALGVGALASRPKQSS